MPLFKLFWTALYPVFKTEKLVIVMRVFFSRAAAFMYFRFLLCAIWEQEDGTVGLNVTVTQDGYY
jgi:hypothetical protein